MTQEEKDKLLKYMSVDADGYYSLVHIEGRKYEYLTRYEIID